jgi:hypothetical protein
MASSTSSDIDLKIYDNYGNDIPIPPLKKETSETDLYLNMLDNTSKAKLDTEKSTSSLRFDDKKDTETSSVRNSYKNKESTKNHNTFSVGSDNRSDYRDSYKHRDSHVSRSSRSSRSSRTSDSSKARYEDVKISNNSEIEEKKPVLTGQQLRMKKIELLRKLCDLKTKGYKLSKEYDFNSSIEEMEWMKGVEFTIELKDGMKPKPAKPKVYSDKEKEALASLIKIGMNCRKPFLRWSTSPYGENFTFSPKPDGTLRICTACV